MRLLFIARNFRQGWGGAPESIRLMARQLRALGVESDVMDGARIHRNIEALSLLPDGSAGGAEFGVEMLDRYSAVLQAGPWQNPIRSRAIVTRLREDQPFVYLPRGGLADIEFEGLRSLKKRPYFRLVERHLLDSADTIVFSSEAERNGSSRLARYSAKALVIPDFFEWIQDEPESRADRLPDGVLSIGFLGEISRRKGLLPFVEGASFWAGGSGPGRRLRIRVGGAPRPGAERYLREVKEVCDSAANLEVEFLGAVSHESRSAFYASVDALALPSLFESFGLVALEALASGKPILCANGLGALEQLTGNPDILTFESLRPAAVAAALDKLADRSPSTRADHLETARRARQHVAEINRIAAQLWRTVLFPASGDTGFS